LQTSQNSVATGGLAMQEEMQMLRALNSSLEEALEKKSSELTAAREDVTKHAADIREWEQKFLQCDNQVMLYKFQAEVYRADFDAERSARESAQGEKDTLHNRVKELEQLARELQDEINGIAVERLPGRRDQQPPSRNPSGTFRHLGGNDMCDSSSSQIGEVVGAAAECLPEEEPRDVVPLIHCPRCQDLFPSTTALCTHYAQCRQLHRQKIIKP